MNYSPALQLAKDNATYISGLNHRERLYAEARMLGSPPVAAATIAGCMNPNVEADALEANPLIRNLLCNQVRSNMLSRKLSKEDVLAGFMDAVHASSNSMELVAAWREIGKVLGVYAPEKVDVSDARRDDLRRLPDKELLSLIEADYEVVDFV